MKRPSTTDILINIAKCIFLFYCVYYGCSSIIYGIYSLEHYDGTIPFDFKTWVDLAECCTYNRTQMVNTLSLVVTFPIAGAVYGLVILSWAWDYAVTTALVHFGLSCLVMLDFPYLWSWWLCLGVGLVLMVGFAELVSWLRRYRNKSRLIVPASAANQECSFLYK